MQNGIFETTSNNYKQLHAILFDDIQKSTATSSTYDLLPVVVNHFTNLSRPLCIHKNILPDAMTRSMNSSGWSRLLSKLEKTKKISRNER